MKTAFLLALGLIAASHSTTSAQPFRSTSWNPEGDRLLASVGRSETNRNISRRLDPRQVPLLPDDTLTNSSGTPTLRRDIQARLLSRVPEARVIDTRVTDRPAGSSTDLSNANWNEVWVVLTPVGTVQYRIAFAGKGKNRGINYRARIAMAEAQLAADIGNAGSGSVASSGR